MNTVTENENKQINIKEAKRLIDGAEISQEELAVLARLAARRKNLHQARKLNRSNVSLVLHGHLTEGQVYDAIICAIEEYLGVRIDVSSNGR